MKTVTSLLLAMIVLSLQMSCAQPIQSHWLIGHWEGKIEGFSSKEGPARTLQVNAVSSDGTAQARWAVIGQVGGRAPVTVDGAQVKVATGAKSLVELTRQENDMLVGKFTLANGRVFPIKLTKRPPHVSDGRYAEAPVYKDGDWWRVRVEVTFLNNLYHAGYCHETYSEYVVKIEGGKPKVYGVQGSDLEEIECSIISKQLLGFGIASNSDRSKGGEGDRIEYLKFPLKVGVSWTSSIPQRLDPAGPGLTSHITRWFNTQHKVTGWQIMKTPKEGLEAFEIEVSGWGWGTAPIYFYSPKVKAIVFFRWMFPEIRRVVRLIDYNVTDAKEGASPKLEIEEKVGIKEKGEIKTPPIGAEAAMSHEVAQGKGAIPTVKAEEVPQVAATKPPEPKAAPPINEEIALKKELPVQPAIAPLTLRMNIIGQRKEADGSYTEVLVNEGSVLRSRDNCQVHLESSRPAYVYVLIYDSEGRASQLFPDPKIEYSGAVEAGQTLIVPGSGSWFWLDDSTGTETIYVLASEKPMPDIRGLLAKMETADDAGQKRAAQEIKQQIAVMQRGVGGITKGQAVTYTLSDGKKIQKVTDVVTGTGSVVRAVSFQHR